MPSQYPNHITPPVLPTTLSQLYQWAVAHQLPLALYRLPDQQEPVCLVQASGTALQLRNPWDALGMKGFVVAPWIGDKSVPSVLIRADHTLHGWNPDTAILSQGIEAAYIPEMPIPDEVDAPFETYQQQVLQIQAAITEGTIEKAILSRIVSHEVNTDFDAVTAFQKAATEYPHAFCYLVNLPGIGQWMGASPEVLMGIQGQQITTVALAGTKPNTASANGSVAWGEKEQHEHELVRSHILELLQQHATNVHADGPNTIQAGNLYHLRTDFTAQLPAGHTIEVLTELLQAMHPTPAISGTPKDAAIKLIAEVEHHQRAYYAGFIGPIAAEEELHLYVNLRCMRVLPSMALLYVGGGITAGSAPHEEWLETQAKAHTLLDILG